MNARGKTPRSAMSEAFAKAFRAHPQSRDRGFGHARLAQRWQPADGDDLLEYSLGYAEGEIARLLLEQAPKALPPGRRLVVGGGDGR